MLWLRNMYFNWNLNESSDSIALLLAYVFQYSYSFELLFSLQSIPKTLCPKGNTQKTNQETKNVRKKQPKYIHFLQFAKHKSHNIYLMSSYMCSSVSSIWLLLSLLLWMLFVVIFFVCNHYIYIHSLKK